MTERGVTRGGAGAGHVGAGGGGRAVATSRDGRTLWDRTFETVEDLRQALAAFKRLYSVHRRLQRLGDRPPTQARRDACSALKVAA